jgi:two-component system response regulator MprA
MSGCILVVDDSPDVLEAMKMILESARYVVLTAPDGKVALDQLRDGAAPSLILLDMMMPRMNGWQFLDELHHDLSVNAIPVVVVSSGSYPTKEIESLGVAGYLKKPFDVSTLLETVERYCSPAPTTAPLP